MIISVVVVVFGIAMNLGPTEKISQHRQIELQQAVDFAIRDLGNSLDVGFSSPTALQRCEYLISTQFSVPGEQPLPIPPIDYRLDKPDDFWQVVLIPNESNRTVRIEAYAEQIATPVAVHTVAIPIY